MEADLADCLPNSKTVCFSGNCDIFVDYSSGAIEKDGYIVSFEGDALMYAAIFSDEEIYECELKRLMKRTRQLTSIYQSKALNLVPTGCDSTVKGDLATFFGSLTDYIEGDWTSATLGVINPNRQIMDVKNRNGGCKLW